MKKKTDPLEDIQEIKKMMESSSKFLSLSGLSGIFAGLTALAGAALAYYKIYEFNHLSLHYYATGRWEQAYHHLDLTLMAIAAGVLIIALGFGVLFSAIKAKKLGQKLWSPIAFRLLRSLMTPLFFGGVFVIGLYKSGAFFVIAPAMLIFYGMALLNASKYLNQEIKYLALCEMALGAVLSFIPGYGLWFWALGFGLLHIIYGAIMYFRYDYNQSTKESVTIE